MGDNVVEEVVYSYEELLNAFSKSDEEELPKPYVYILFTNDSEEKKTVNDFLCRKGEIAVRDYMKFISPSREMKLIIFKLNINNVEMFHYHPVVRLKDYPLLMTVDGSRRLEGGQVADPKLLNIFFEEQDSPQSATPCFRVLNHSPLARTIDRCKNYWKYIDHEDEPIFKFPEGFPGRAFGEIMNSHDYYTPSDECNFWNVKEAILRKAEAKAEVENIATSYDLKTTDATKYIEERIRKEFQVKPLRKVISASKSVKSKECLSEITENAESIPNPDVDYQTEEPIVSFNLDDFCLKKEVIEIERKKKIVPLPKKQTMRHPEKPKKGKGKKKKGKKGGKKGKGKKGRGTKGGKKGKGKKKGK